jgi:hypothetical protein
LRNVVRRRGIGYASHKEQAKDKNYKFEFHVASLDPFKTSKQLVK